jgi:autotransporter-associated beta strand protein
MVTRNASGGQWRRKSAKAIRVCSVAASAAAGTLMAQGFAAGAGVFNWTGTTSTAWTEPTNWDVGAGFPQATDDTANFTGAVGSLVPVLNDGITPITVGTLLINSTAAFTLGQGTGTSPLTFNGSSTSGATVTANMTAAVTLATNIALASNTSFVVTGPSAATTNIVLTLGAATSTLSLGSFTLNATPHLGTATVSLNNIIIAALTTNSTTDNASINILAATPTTVGAKFRFTNNANDFTGTITVGNGQTLDIQQGTNTTASIGLFGSPSLFGRGNGISDASSLIINGGGTLDLAAQNGETTTFSRLFSIGNTPTITIGGNATSFVNFNATGAIGFINNQTKNLTLTGVNAATQNCLFSPQLTDNGTSALSITKASANIWTLNGTNNTYTGTTQINRGVVRLGANSAIGTSLVSFGAGANPLSFDLNGKSQTVSGVFATTATPIVGNALAASTSSLTINIPSSSTSGKYLGTISNTGVLNLVKTGAGSQSLLGPTNNFNGGSITINNGLLALGTTGSTFTGIDPVNGVTVQTGGALGGAGTITGKVTYVGSGNGLAPGNSAGVLSIVGAVDLGTGTSGATILNYELPATPGGLNDETDVTGTLAVASNYVVNVLSINATGVYPLIKYTGAGPGGDPTQWTVTGPFPGFAANVLSNAGEIDLNVTSVPEPSTIACLGLAGLGILAKRRRRDSHMT